MLSLNLKERFDTGTALDPWEKEASLESDVELPSGNLIAEAEKSVGSAERQPALGNNPIQAQEERRQREGSQSKAPSLRRDAGERVRSLQHMHND